MFVRRRCCCAAPCVVPACCCGCHAVPCVALSTLACRHALRVAGRGARLVVPHRRALVLVRLRTAGCRVLRRLRLRRCRSRVRAVRACRRNSMPGCCHCYGLCSADREVGAPGSIRFRRSGLPQLWINRATFPRHDQRSLSGIASLLVGYAVPAGRLGRVALFTSCSTRLRTTRTRSSRLGLRTL